MPTEPAAPGAVIRPYRPGDRDGVGLVCLRTAAAGQDATGAYSDDRLMPEVYALPYVDYDPSLAFVVADGDRVLGYVLGIADTADFVGWWEREWSPGFRERHPRPAVDAVGASHEAGSAAPRYSEADLIADGTRPERMLIPELAEYPAHLHIDLLPEVQRRGFGRRLIARLLDELAERGVRGLHLGLAAENASARRFYERLGFRELASSTPESPRLGIRTRDELR
ncbi:GNAT family N-acetyltransferase [Agromyces archimandritae]|uniref:GNAT family N-acetyltransferase n=1 Tax=Agromyces archimandritae TaxID=2781962 RepID=A0A975FKR0_9MICO|nr:GNAT family N-acetyltransferase [Agromyces archimandritae]QTX03879.1 GNAT family N-acetyltransferase [Agromyces archimandritae]